MATVISFPPLRVVVAPPGLAPGKAYWWSFDPHESHNGGAFIVTAHAMGTTRGAIWVSDMSVVVHRSTFGDINFIKTGVDCTLLNTGSETIKEFSIHLTRITR